MYFFFYNFLFGSEWHCAQSDTVHTILDIVIIFRVLKQYNKRLVTSENGNVTGKDYASFPIVLSLFNQFYSKFLH